MARSWVSGAEVVVVRGVHMTRAERRLLECLGEIALADLALQLDRPSMREPVEAMHATLGIRLRDLQAEDEDQRRVRDARETFTERAKV